MTVFYYVKAGPPEMESLVQDGGCIRHIGDEVGLAGDERVDLRNEGLVRCFFVGFEFGEVGEDTIHF